MTFLLFGVKILNKPTRWNSKNSAQDEKFFDFSILLGIKYTVWLRYRTFLEAVVLNMYDLK